MSEYTFRANMRFVLIEQMLLTKMYNVQTYVTHELYETFSVLTYVTHEYEIFSVLTYVTHENVICLSLCYTRYDILCMH